MAIGYGIYSIYFASRTTNHLTTSQMKFSIFSLLACSIISAFTANAQNPVPCEAPYPKVENLTVSLNEIEKNIVLSWTPILGSLGCRIQVRKPDAPIWISRQVVQTDLSEFIINGFYLEYQTDYEARVACGCSIDPLIIGDYSESVLFNTGTAGQQVPCENPYPEVLNPSAASTAENDAIVLSWDPIPQSLGCQIEYSLLEGGVLNTAQIFENELSSFSIPEGDLIPNQDYQWRVRCGCSLNPLVAGPWVEYQEFNSGEIGFDCPNLDANIGDPCDDGNDETLNDSISVNCECIGINLCPDNIPEGTVCNPLTGRIWMDRNLGASRVALSPTDAEAYGDLYQWGRGPDGHQSRTSPITSTLSSSNQPGNGSFINVWSFPFDWRSPQNDNLWQGVNGINNPCPSGFRLPTEEEWIEERGTWASKNIEGAYGSPLKLTAGGARITQTGVLFNVGGYGSYWSSTVSGININRQLFDTDAYIQEGSRAGASSVRCIQD
jgi:hypothetical protein